MLLLSTCVDNPETITIYSTETKENTYLTLEYLNEVLNSMGYKIVSKG